MGWESGLGLGLGLGTGAAGIKGELIGLCRACVVGYCVDTGGTPAGKAGKTPGASETAGGCVWYSVGRPNWPLKRGGKQGNQTASRWMDHMVVVEGYYLQQRVADCPGNGTTVLI